jgi:RNA polymerase II subunit A small phosphatase-like protein
MTSNRSAGLKQQVKQSKKSKNTVSVPYPNIITQVSKEDENKYKLLKFLRIYKCCSMFLKCFASKKPEFDQLIDSPINSFLEPQLPEFKGKKTLVLDLDETLVHSTFEPVQNPDLILPVRIQGMTYKINVIKRPGVEEFLAEVGEMFEVVIFTASLSEYAEPLVRILDTTNTISALLYRQHCTLLNGVYVKDLSLIGRDPKDVILVDNSPNSFLLQPENAYHIKNFFDDKTDRELTRLSAFLQRITKVDDVRPIESLRHKFEPAHPPKVMKFVKKNQDSDAEPSSKKTNKASYQLLKKKEEVERPNNIETEPDMRKDDRDEKIQSSRFKTLDRNGSKPKQFEGFSPRAAPLTDRVAVNDRLLDQSLESTEDIELPSPKESDNLIYHKQSEEENNSKATKKPTLFKSSSAIFKKIQVQSNIVAVQDPTLEGENIEDVRYHTGIDNLNSPLGKHAKIEFKNKTDVGI